MSSSHLLSETPAVLTRRKASGETLWLVVNLLLSSLLLLGPLSAETATPKSGTAGQPVSQIVEQTIFPIPPISPEFQPETVYQILLGEIAGQRGEYSLANQLYFKAAHSTQDPQIIKRSAEIALYSKSYQQAAEVTKLWLKINPHSIQAQRSLIAALLHSRQYAEALSYLKGYLQDKSIDAGDTFLQLANLLGQQKNDVGMTTLSPADSLEKAFNPIPVTDAAPKSLTTASSGFEFMAAATQPYPMLAEAQYALAYLGLLTDLKELSVMQKSLAAIERALLVKPDWMQAVILKSQLLRRTAPNQALNTLKNFLGKNPGSYEVRIALSTMLYEQKQLEAARTELLIAAKLAPPAHTLHLRSALISLQLNDAAFAKSELKQLMESGYPDTAAIHYFYGQAYEIESNFSDALTEFREVQGDEYYFPAQLKIASILAKQGKLAEAQGRLHALQPIDEAQAIRIAQTEVQLLRDADKKEEALALLQEKAAAYPLAIELHYDLGVTAERANQLDVAERAFRHVIELNPNLSIAYNALGYAFANRNIRLSEAWDLLEKAHQLAPQDPAILDSLGWVCYRQGKMGEALTYLRRANIDHENPEIVAHLGEVLWVTGEQTQARAVWQKQLEKTPGSLILKETMRRFISGD